MSLKLNRPTSLSPSSIKEFQQLYLEAKGVLLSDSEAEQQGLNVINFIATLLELDDQERS
jgi:hypothetical protein